jgi:4-hydroxybenzoate polyprenyltransferase
MMDFTKYYFYFLIFPFLHLFFYQIRIFNLNKPSDCLIAFKSNNLFGLLVFINILIGKNF